MRKFLSCAPKPLCDLFATRKSDVTTEPNRRHVVVTLLNRLLRRRNSEHLQLANQTRCDCHFWCDVTIDQASFLVQITLLHLKRQAGNRTGRVLDRRALAKQDYCAVFSQDDVTDRRHVRAEFFCRDVPGRRVIAERPRDARGDFPAPNHVTHKPT